MNVQALSNYMAAVATKPFRLGNYDCVRFVAECLLVGWDRDYRDALGYLDRRSAVTRLRRDGGLPEAVDKVLGERIDWQDLKPGDVAFFDDPHATIGLVMPGYVAIKTGRSILRILPEYCEFGWRS